MCSSYLTFAFHQVQDFLLGFAQVCPDVLEREVFQCGPDAMMNGVLRDLESLGLSSSKVHQESFAF